MRITVEYKQVNKDQQWLFYNIGTPKFNFVLNTAEDGFKTVQLAIDTYNKTIESRGLSKEQEIEIVDWKKLDS